MLKFNKSVVVASIILALGTVAFAEGSDWIMRPNQGYVIDRDGHVKIVDLHVDSVMVAKARRVKRGTAFFMHNGEVMMAYDSGTEALLPN